MKILLMNDYNFGHGGAEVVFQETKKVLEEHGHMVETISENNPKNLGSLKRGWFNWHYYVQTRKLIKDFNPDIVHVHGCTRKISPSPLIAAKQNKLPIVMTLHDFEIIGPQAALVSYNFKYIRKIKLAYQRYVINRTVDYFISPSKLLTTYGSKSFITKKINYIPNFTTLTNKQREIDNTNSNIFLYVGRLSKEKGVDIAIKAVEYLVHKDGINDVKLVILGNGPDKQRLVELVTKLKLQNNITFLGKIAKEHLLDYYKKSISVLIPSIWMENRTLVVYEAMVASIPIIASNIGGLPEVVEHNKNGLLFEMGNASELANYMKILYNDKELGIKMGKYGYDMYHKDYTRDKYYDNVINLYNKVLKTVPK